MQIGTKLPQPVFRPLKRKTGEDFPGDSLSDASIRSVDSAARASLEGRVTPHTLRHTFATRLVRATGNLEVTRKALRHARIQTTAGTYAHLVQEDVDRGIRELPGSESYPQRGGEDLQEQIRALQAQLEALATQAGVRNSNERLG